MGIKLIEIYNYPEHCQFYFGFIGIATDNWERQLIGFQKDGDKFVINFLFFRIHEDI